MNLSILRDNVGKMDFYTKENTGENTYVGKKSSSRNKDTIEISDEAYAAQHGDQITATSGKDILGISKGDKENTFIIHFADSAMVSRAVSRGYITVNGIRIELSDEVKENLIETDKQAEADRMAAFNDYVMQHELAVAQQQREAWKKAAEESMDAFEIAAKISSGRPITSSEAQRLMKFDPQLYAMAMSALAMSKNHERQENIGYDYNTYTPQKNVEGVEWSQFEWKTYESRITVSLEDNTVGDVFEGEVILNSGK